jgi:hypothetical protein
MKIDPYISPFSKTYRIRARENALIEITVSQYEDFQGNWTVPKINWPGCGDQSYSATNEFAATLAKAMEICALLVAGKEVKLD